MNFGSTLYLFSSILIRCLLTTSSFLHVEATPLRPSHDHPAALSFQFVKRLPSQTCEPGVTCPPAPSTADLGGAKSALRCLAVDACDVITGIASTLRRRTSKTIGSPFPTQTEVPLYTATRVILVAGPVAGVAGLAIIFGVIFHLRREAFARAFRRRKSRMAMRVWPSPLSGASLTASVRGRGVAGGHQRRPSGPTPPPRPHRQVKRKTMAPHRKSRWEWKSAHPSFSVAQSPVSAKQTAIRIIPPQKPYLSPFSTSQPYLSPFSTSQPHLSPSSVGSIQLPARMMSLHSIIREREQKHKLQQLQRQSPLTPPAPTWAHEMGEAAPVELPATPLSSSHFAPVRMQREVEPPLSAHPTYQGSTPTSPVVSPNFRALGRPAREVQRRDSATYGGFI